MCLAKWRKKTSQKEGLPWMIPAAKKNLESWKIGPDRINLKHPIFVLIQQEVIAVLKWDLSVIPVVHHPIKKR